MELRTVSKSDPDFRALLRGTFSRELVALPMRSLNVNTSSEVVTFQLVPLQEVERPKSLPLILSLLRIETLAFSLGPVLVALIAAFRMGYSVQLETSIFAVLSILFFHLSLNLFNDYFDHLKGQDRLNPRGGSRVIQKGWVRAYLVERWAFGFLLVAANLALPIFFEHKLLSVLVSLGVLFLGIEYSSERLGLKYRGWSEVIVFILTGPVLSAGIVWAVTGQWSWPIALVGTLLGLSSGLHYNLIHFANIMIDAQAGLKTLAVRLGFDKAKSLYLFFTGVMLLSLVAIGLVLNMAWPYWAVVLCEGSLLMLLAKKIWEIASPLSSELIQVRRWGVYHQWFVVVVLSIACGFWL